MQKVILDVDTGIDDALAIMLATESEELDILGITTVSGNVSLEQATRNTLKVLQMVGKEKEINVYPGAFEPLLRKKFHEHRVHGNDGLGGALTDMELRAKPSSKHAAHFIIDQVHRYPNEVTLIMTAPLTNLVHVLKLDPTFARDVKRVIFMGGAAKTQGNVTPVAEFNIYADPEAAKIVFHSGIPLTMVGLDVTMKTLLHDYHVDELKGSRYYDFIHKSAQYYMNFRQFDEVITACPMHDPLAVGVAIDPTMIQTESLYVDVETESSLCDGQTVCDLRFQLNQQENMDVALDVDSDRFISMLLHRLK
ncbi:nucleoside hydrolase [Terrilactibacillus sp. BCM23-1]|uniref:Nucleoside hydrolase n=1 Tax=Terrilactibacillus tamarindi TaxID=2599694 RepID=A0A6N8CQ45_9BACI|nr:nucleoside hydrolase [Terrilactibacillus tamarindi]MTT31287.1 nucleoside hydrolase [Terrilactibacillus tamarindi]